MKLEIGKRYITRNGQVTGPVQLNQSSQSYPYTTEIAGVIKSFTKDGKFYLFGRVSYLDLMEEYVDEVEQEGIRLLSEELEELSKSNHVPEIEEETVTTPDDSTIGNINAGVTMDDIYKYLADEESGDEDSDFMKIAKNAARLLEYKNKKYGNSALNPINVFNGKSAVGQRADDKISRIQNNPTLQKNDIVDLLGYLILIIKENEWENFDEFMD